MANNKQYIDILNAVVSQEESRLITIAIFGIVLVLVTLLLPSKILTLKFGKSSRSKKYSINTIKGNRARLPFIVLQQDMLFFLAVFNYFLEIILGTKSIATHNAMMRYAPKAISGLNISNFSEPAT